MGFWYEPDAKQHYKTAEKIIKNQFRKEEEIQTGEGKPTKLNLSDYARLPAYNSVAKILIDEGFGYASDVVKIFLKSVEEELPDLFYMGASTKEIMGRLDDIRDELFGGEYEDD